MEVEGGREEDYKYIYIYIYIYEVEVKKRWRKTMIRVTDTESWRER